MERCKIWLGPEVETVEAVNYFGMDMGKLAFYEVNVQTVDGEAWKVRRRYQMFADLHAQVRQQRLAVRLLVGDIPFTFVADGAQLERYFNCIPPCPPKLYDVGSFALARYFLSSEKVNAQYTPEFLAQRRQDLEQWMQRLHRIPCVACFPVFLSFLEADKNESLKTYFPGPPEINPVIKGVTLDEATQVLAKSHMENPLWKHIFPLLSDKDLFEALNGVMGLYALTCFEYGYAMAIKDGAQMSATCLLIPPGSKVSHLDLFVAGFAKLSYKIGTVATKTFTTVLNQMEEHHESIMGRTPHWYIMCFGTDPNCSGQGQGGQLMKGILRFIDETQMPVYLECTDDAKAKGFFQKYGFNVEEYHEQPTLSYMLRPAMKGSASGGAAAAAPSPAAPQPEPQPQPASRGDMPTATVGGDEEDEDGI